jgi:threonine dehydrogenase-like Zn-dependent dehydrogenase
MKALRFDDGLRVAEIPVPQPEPGEALIRVERSGVCNTDVELTRGYMDFRGTLGHEFCGVVARAEDPSLVGRRVSGEINLWCGVCETCRAGERTHCPRRTVLGILGRDGAHAEYVTLPARNLHRVPRDVPVEAAALIEPLAACCRILEQRPVAATERAVVVGDGKLAFLAAQDLFERLGIAVALAERWEGRADVVVECSGAPGGFETAARAVRPRGTIVLKTTCAEDVPLDTSRVVVDEVTVIGSRCGPFESAIALLAEGAVDVAPFIEETLPLSRGVEAINRAQAPGSRKILLDPSR